MQTGASPMATALARAFATVLAATLLVVGVELALFHQNVPELFWVVALFPTSGLVYVAFGVLAWWRRPSNGLGALLVVAGFGQFVGGLGNTGVTALVLPAVVLATVSLAFIVHLALAYPSGRLLTRSARTTVAAGYAVVLVLQAPLYLFDPAASPDGRLAVGDAPTLASVGRWVQAACGISVLLVTAALLVQRMLRDRPDARRHLPLYAYATLVVPAIPLLHDIPSPLTPTAVAAVQLLLITGVPVAFVAAILRGAFAPTNEMHELGTWLGSADSTRSTLAGPLARALGDDSIRLVFWVPATGYIDAFGDPAPAPGTGAGRGAVDIELDGRRIGAIDYDAELIAEPELVRSAGAVVAIAMDRERLTADLLASRQALQQSRERLVEAADRERRRIAQNLHDGVQVKLVLLALEAQQLAEPSIQSVPHAAARLRHGIDRAASELRTLVYDLVPAPLIERGLYAATEDLADRLPIPTRVSISSPDAALPPAVEGTAYLVVAEALANAVKHSGATQLDVALDRRPGVLRIEVRDDGVGGAVPGGGLGLRGILDRVDALGGRVELHSPPGAGTRLRMELPCAS